MFSTNVIQHWVTSLNTDVETQLFGLQARGILSDLPLASNIGLALVTTCVSIFFLLKNTREPLVADDDGALNRTKS